ncbi:MAG: glycosyltransferase [Dysgonomonas sp.]|nr:glycosyltransferase [Dysgonomonas sp.]
MVDILLATYNGDLYIEQQILSLQSQTFDQWRLLIHDDGSHDNTISIIKRFAAIDKRIILIEDGIKHGNAAANFMHLINFADAPFIMFCDQDDIWFDNKIETMYDSIRLKDSSIPQVLYSNSFIWDPTTNKKRGLSTITFPKTLSHLLFLNSGMQGCVAIFNRKTLELMKLWRGNCAMHDHILHLIGLSMGNVTYLKENLMLYRQHENNVTGDTAGKEVDINRVINNRKFPVVDKKHYDSIIAFLRNYELFLSTTTKNILNIYISMPTLSFINKLKEIVKWDFRIYDSKAKLILKILLRPFV